MRLAGPEALPAFLVLAEAQAAWLWARGIRQWKPGGIRARQAELADKLAQGWLVTAVVPDECELEMVTGCLLVRLAPPHWQGRMGAGVASEGHRIILFEKTVRDGALI